jgi:hypothetical protein
MISCPFTIGPAAAAKVIGKTYFGIVIHLRGRGIGDDVAEFYVGFVQGNERY